MTDAEKIAKFEELQRAIWGIVLGNTPANLVQQLFAAQAIRAFKIPGPNGEQPEDA